MDTDGFVNKADNHLEFSVSCEPLARGMASLVRGLGGMARLAVKQAPTYRYKGELRTGAPHWRVTIQLPDDVLPFKLPRKADIYRPREKYKPLRLIESIEPAGTADCVAITVASDDGMFLVEDFIPMMDARVPERIGIPRRRPNRRPRQHVIKRFWCEAGEHHYEREWRGGPFPKHCADHKPKPVPAKRPVTVTCEAGDHEWQWNYRAGRKPPRCCPDHR